MSFASRIGVTNLTPAGSNGGNYVTLSRFTASSTRPISSILSVAANSGSAFGVVYSGSANNPDTLVSYGPRTAVVSGQNQLPITPFLMVSGTNYWIGAAASVDGAATWNNTSTYSVDLAITYSTYVPAASFSGGNYGTGASLVVQGWGYDPPVISDITLESGSGEVQGTDFESAQGAGALWFCNTNDFDTATIKVLQNPTSWNTSAIEFTPDFTGLTGGATAYAFVETNSDQVNAAGEAFTVPISATPPIVEYTIDEAASGTTPTSLLDKSASPLNLPITYESGVTQYFEESTGRGLNFGASPAVRGVGAFYGPLDGTDKVSSVLHATRTGTFEVVITAPASWPTSEKVGAVACIMAQYGEGSDEFGPWIWRASDGNTYLEFSASLTPTIDNSSYIKRRYNITALTGQRLVIHEVLDTAQASEPNRMKIYVNGSAVTTIRDTVTNEGTGDMPQNGEVGCLGANTPDDGGWDDTYLSIGGIKNYGPGDVRIGTSLVKITYAAVYLRALPAAEIATRYTTLAADDDLAWGEDPFTPDATLDGFTSVSTWGSANGVDLVLDGFASSSQWEDAHVAIKADGFESNIIWGNAEIAYVDVAGFESSSEWGDAYLSIKSNGFESLSQWSDTALQQVVDTFISVSLWNDANIVIKADGFESDSTWYDFDIQYEASGFQSSSEWKDAHVSQVSNWFDSDSLWSDVNLAQVVDGINSDSTWGDVSNAIVLDGFTSSSVWGDTRVAIKADGFESDSVWGNIEVAYSGTDAFESSSEWGDGYLSIKADGFESVSQWNDVYSQQVVDGFNSISEWGDALIPDAPLNASGFNSRSAWGDTVTPVYVDRFDSDSIWNDAVIPEMYSSFESASGWNDFAVESVLSGFESISEWSDFSSQISASGFGSISLWGDVELVGAPEEVDGFTSNSVWNDTVYAISIDGFESSSLWVDTVTPEYGSGFDSDSEWNDTSIIAAADGFISESSWLDVNFPIMVSGFESDSVWTDLSVAIEMDGISSVSQWNDLREVEILSTFDSNSDFGDLIVLYFVDSFDSVSTWGNVTPSRPIPRMGYNVIDIGVNVETYTSIVAYVGRL